MDHNPYSPPQTDVREPVVPDSAGPCPKQVSWAVRLLWTDLVISGLELAWQMSRKVGDDKFGITLVATIVVAGALFGLEALVITKLAARRNWARYVTLVATLLDLVTSLGTLSEGRAADPVKVALEAIELMLDSGALFLIFTSPGKQWFKRA